MIRRASKFAIGPSIGIVIGHLIFRMANPNLYDHTWPSIPLQAVLYLIVSYISSFFIILIIEWITAKLKKWAR